MTDLLNPPADYVAYIPARKAKPQPHVLSGAIRIPPELSPSGFEQVEKTCKNCGAVRVTVLAPGAEHRQWRWTADGPQVDDAPPCPQAGRVA